jgi:hypothetical protein
MADYTLTNGKGTAVREDAGAQEGYVDLDINSLIEEATPIDTDHLALQRGSDDPRKVPLGKVRGGYDTLWIPAAAMAPSETDGATAATKGYATEGMTHDVMTFAGADNDTHAAFDVVMPEAWDRGAIKVKVYWTAGGDANIDEWVEFYLAAGARSDDDALDAALGTAVNIVDQFIAADDLHVSPASAALTVGGTPALGDLIHFKLSRDYDHDSGGGGVAMDVDAHVLGVLIQYQKTENVAAW